jgi:hypothetical protein
MPSSNVMTEFKSGTLHSGSPAGPKVQNPKQAVAIMLSEKAKEGKPPSFGAKRGPKASTKLVTGGVKKFKKHSPKK